MVFRGTRRYERLGSSDVELSSMEKGEKKDGSSPYSKNIGFWELVQVLMPFFWPASGTDGAMINRIRSTSTWLAVALSKACNLVSPLYLAAATNNLTSGDYKGACIDLLIYSSLRLGSSVFKELQSILYIRVKQEASIQLQELTFRHIHNLSLNWHLSKKTGSIMKSMDRGVGAADTLVTYLFLFLIPALLECLSVMILFFVEFKQWQLGVVIFIGVALYAVVTVVLTTYRKKFREETNKHDNDFHDKATDSIINYETVKYFTGEDYEVDRFTKSVRQYQKFNSTTQLSLSALNISQQLFINLTVCVTMIIAGRAVVQGEMTIGGWIAVQTWVMTIFQPLNFLGMVYMSLVQAFVDIKNLSELLSQSPDVIDSPTATDLPLPLSTSSSLSLVRDSHSAPYPAAVGVSVEFKHINFHYPGQTEERGLKDVCFLVKAGTTTAIVGHTGAGKTTISRLLFRFYDPTGGAVLIGGCNIRDYKQRSVRQAIGIVPQDTVLFNDTILHNIEYGRIGAPFEDIVRAAQAAQILNFIESLPDKWNTMVGERGLKLSGGEKQRVAIARCLLKNPPVVLLDEATSALDTLTESSIQEALTTLGKNRTVLVIAHRLSTVRHADQIVVMDEGRVIEVGSHDELIAREGSQYGRLWMMQVNPSFSSATSLSPYTTISPSPVEGENNDEAAVTSPLLISDDKR